MCPFGFTLIFSGARTKPTLRLYPIPVTTFESKTTWGASYDEFGLGGLLAAPLSPLGGFGKFLLVILALSIVANNSVFPPILLSRPRANIILISTSSQHVLFRFE